MAFMRTRVAILKAARHARRAIHTVHRAAEKTRDAVDRTVDRVGRVVEKTAHAVDRVHGHVRPVYNFARPFLHHHGIDTSIPDRALSNYDAIRRSVINGYHSAGRA